MKQLVLLLMFSTLFLTAHSQLSKGIWLAGGTGQFYAYKSQYISATYSNEASYTQIDLSPNIGHFVADKLVFGLKPTFSSIKGKVTTAGGGTTNVQRYLIGPFGRYYFLNSDNQTNIVADASYQLGWFGGISRGQLSKFSAMVGPVVFFNSSVGLEFLLGYAHRKEDVESYQKDIRKGFQIAVGFQIHLEK